MRKMKKYPFESSNEVLEIEELNVSQAKQLINKLKIHGEQCSFISLDCVPNGSLKAFSYGNGLESAKIIRDLGDSYIGPELPWFEKKIWEAEKSNFKLDFKIGEELKLWERITPNNYLDKIDWNQAFCVKNAKGQTKIWHPQWRRFGDKFGCATKGSIIRFIQEETAYLQNFYLPLNNPNYAEKWKMFYRLVFLSEAGKKDPEFIGGLWISRPSFKIYPGTNSIVGLISPLTITDRL